MAEVLNPFGPSSLLLVPHLSDISILHRDQSFPLYCVLLFGEWRPLSLHIYVDMDVHGLFMTATPLLWSDTFRNEAHFNYLINTTFSSTQFPSSRKLACAVIFLGTLRVYILDLVYNFIDHPYH